MVHAYTSVFREHKIVVAFVLLSGMVTRVSPISQAESDLQQIYIAEAPRLYGYLVRRTDPDSAQDIVQEAFVRLYARLRRSGDVVHARAYLFQIARHLLYKETDAARHVIGDAQLDALAAPAAGNSPGHSDQQELLRVLDRAVALLSAKERELFELRWYENLTQAEIAVVLKKSERQIRRDIEKLVSRLRASFREQGWPVDGADLV